MTELANAYTAQQELPRAQAESKLATDYYKELHTRIDLLFKKEKGLFGAQKKLRRPQEPLAFVFRTYGIVDMYEGIRGDTFIIPPGLGKAKSGASWNGGKEGAKKQGQRTAYLTSRDLYEISWGTNTVKAYFINENDAMPLNGDPKVWSERLEYTIDAILLNFENFKRKQQNTMDWLPKTVLYAGIAIGIFFLAKGLFPQAIPAGLGGTLGAPTNATAATTIPANISGITIVS